MWRGCRAADSVGCVCIEKRSEPGSASDKFTLRSNSKVKSYTQLWLGLAVFEVRVNCRISNAPRLASIHIHTHTHTYAPLSAPPSQPLSAVVWLCSSNSLTWCFLVGQESQYYSFDFTKVGNWPIVCFCSCKKKLGKLAKVSIFRKKHGV